MNKPFFSVVLPTRNRAELLPLAVQSVLNQTFGDFELIISDNNSSDETPKVAQDFGDNRIKYFRSAKPLSLHGSLEFALSHAQGEFIAFMSDDDAYAKVFLERLSSIIKEQEADVVSCKLAFSYAADVCEYGRYIARESLAIRSFNRQLYVLNSEESVKSLFATARLSDSDSPWKSITFPILVNSIFRASMIEKVKARIPNIFPIIASDIYTSALFLNAGNKYCYIDEPLFLHRRWEGGMTSGGLANFQKHAEPLEYVPLKKLLSVLNYHADAFLRAKSDWGEDFQPICLNWSSYFIACYQEIMYMRAGGIDVSRELEEFEREILKQEKQLQEEIRLVRSNRINTVKNHLKVKLKYSIIGRTGLKLKYKRLIILNAKDDSFNNILEFSKIIDDAFLAKYADK